MRHSYTPGKGTKLLESISVEITESHLLDDRTQQKIII